MAAGDLTTLDALKAWLRLTTSADDALLTGLVTAASRFVVISLASQAYAETRDGIGGRRLVLANTPVTTVASVTVDGVSIAPAPDAVSAGFVFDEASVSLRGHRFCRGVQNVTIAYTAGYAAVPPEIAQACVELAALRYRQMDRIGHVSKSLAGEVVAFTQKDVQEDVDPQRLPQGRAAMIAATIVGDDPCRRCPTRRPP